MRDVLAVRLHHHRRRLGRLRHRQPPGRGPALRILLIEAGPPRHLASCSTCRRASPAWARTPYNWRYETDAAEALQRPRACTGRAARCWAAPARSTPCSTCAATPRTTTTGASSATTAGATTTCCPTSRRAEHNERGGDDFHGAGGPLTSPTSAERRHDQRGLHRGRRAGRLSRATTTSTAPSRKASATTRSRRRNGERWSAAQRLSAARVDASGQPHVDHRRAGRRASCSRQAAPSACATPRDGRDEVARAAREVDPVRRRGAARRSC